MELLKSSKKFELNSQTSKKHSKKQRGQGMTEYIIIVALIGVAAIGVYRLFGDTLRSQMAGLAMEMSGQAATANIGKAKVAATTSSTTASTAKNLSNYNANNQ